MRATGYVLTIAAMVLSLCSCSKSTEPATAAVTVPVQGVKVAPQVVQFAAIGDSMQLVATVDPLNATDRSIVWESTDTSVASVDANGLVTARAVGAGVFVTAFTHDGHHQASVNVGVTP